MGWNEVQHTIDHALWRDIPQNSRFYFVHSYYVEVANAAIDCWSYALWHRLYRCHCPQQFICGAVSPRKKPKDGLTVVKKLCRVACLIRQGTPLFDSAQGTK
jgi:imidazoleglycerol phosphate synthase glutamine amidotransferase subunit HisH